ncbi:tetratricopeptide repeat-containing sensor histidine kinase [Arenibacter algicola]|uniref:Sensor histidine kinase YpdA n=1 Tax=Arenibacter algicola TaxID=616991 RepID=A0A221UZT9_9FLAO|nr:histidine kinase [Arenibacter algicola]ASO06783.1 sensor histidine kinase YpdA [Arenibacter algicola]
MKSGSVLFMLLTICSLMTGQGLSQELDTLSNPDTIGSESVTDTIIINRRNDYVKQALFANPSDTTLTDYANQTLEIAKKNGYSKGIFMALERLGLIYQYSFSNPYKALYYYQKALLVAENHSGLTPFKWGVYGNIGTLYYELEEYGRALQYFKKVMHGNRNLEMTAMANMANVYGSWNRLDSAIYFYGKALDHPKLKENFTYEANLLSNISLMYQQKGNLDEAIRSIEKSLALIDTYHIEFVRPTAYANAAMVYLTSKDYETARRYALEALDLSRNSANLFMERSAWGTLADIYEQERNYSQALDAHKNYLELKDSLNNQNRRVEIDRMRMEFDFNQREALNKEEIERQATLKKSIAIGGGGLLFATLIGFIFYKRRRDAISRQNEAEFKMLVSDTELKALRAQINPHFIFNSLNSIGDYILKNDTRSAYNYLTKFASLMRTVLENSEQEQILLSEELKFIELYLQVESKRLPGKFSYVVNVEEDLDIENILVPPLILQPFLENSIWHGFKLKEKGGHISINFKVECGMLLCSVDDNGNGMGTESTLSNSHKSFGIAITENRLKIYNYRKVAQSTLRIIDKENPPGVRVEISLPLEMIF